MVIEHEFVTTFSTQDVINMAWQFLSARGFVADTGQEPVQVTGPERAAMEMRRGRKSVGRACGTIELPQRIRIEFDRGRVSVAASITGQTRSFTVATPRDPAPGSAKGRALTELLMALVHALEAELTHGDLHGQATAALDALETQLQQQAQKRRRRGRTFLVIAILFVACASGLLIAGAAGLFK